jgi:hypothetical protein
MAYTKKTIWLFEVGGEEFAIVRVENGWAEAEETRKNGQEDTHISFIVTGSGDGFVIEEGEEMIRDYLGEECVNQIIEFFNKNGLPTKETT